MKKISRYYDHDVKSIYSINDMRVSSAVPNFYRNLVYKKINSFLSETIPEII